MGQVVTDVVLRNAVDVGTLPPDAVRACTVAALVDSGASYLVLPEEVVEALGLSRHAAVPVRYADGRVIPRAVAGPVEITIAGRTMRGDAMVGPRGTRALVGQIELERLDLVVDCAARTVGPNPRSPDAPMAEVMRAA